MNLSQARDSRNLVLDYALGICLLPNRWELMLMLDKNGLFYPIKMILCPIMLSIPIKQPLNEKLKAIALVNIPFLD